MKFQISYPIDSVLASQGFGANPAMYADPKYGGIKGHNGIDFFAGHGNPVYATHDGTAYYEEDSAGGRGVIITSDKMFDYKNGQAYFKTIYWHLCDSSKEPQFKSPIEGKGYIKVKNGQLIGYADNTGASTGDHLHFGLKPLDISMNNIEQNNGYLGAIDPNPYFDGSTPAVIHSLEKQIGLLKLIVDSLKKMFSRK